MKKYTEASVSGKAKYKVLTQGNEALIQVLVDKFNEHNSSIIGYIEARREILKSYFDTDACREFVELSSVYEAGNNVFTKIMVVNYERICRDSVREGFIEDLINNVKMRLALCNGSIEEVVGQIKAYYQSGKLAPVAQTWREAVEELEKGKVIYNEPSRSI